MPVGIYSYNSIHYTRKQYIDNLYQIKDYRSQFWGIKRAVNAAKHAWHGNQVFCCMHRKVLHVLKEFNSLLAEYKKITGYDRNITNLEQLDELEIRLIKLEFNLQKLKKYRSAITSINQAIRSIPRRINIEKASKIIREFNNQISNCKRSVGYEENISNRKQLKELEERLNRLDVYNNSLKRLWQALPIKPKRHQDLFLIRRWFYNPKNQPALASVTKLRLSSHITVLPIELSKMRNLQELDLSVNRLTVFPEWISRFPMLRKLNLSGNKLKKFPSVVCQCTTLEILDISINDIEKLPKGVLQLSNLIELNLRLNRIMVIPNWIRRFKALKLLDLSYNGITEIPFELFQCLTLETLDLSNNWIEKQPLALSIWKEVKRCLIADGRANLRQLETIKLTGNPVVCRRAL